MMLSPTTVDHHSLGIATFAEGDRATLASIGERGREQFALPTIPVLAIVDERILARECLSRTLQMSGAGFDIATFDSIDAMYRCDSSRFSAILVYVGDADIERGPVGRSIRKLVLLFHNVPVIIQSEISGLEQVSMALHHGIRGYLSTKVGVDVCIEAISLAIAGGIFIAAENTNDLQGILAKKDFEARSAGKFTPRERDIIQLLREGKANKSIAYELHLAANTVKVHMHNIMRKLNATNRTEAIFKIAADD
ncbi:LuxR family transcriptional regulator [Phyllobacterium zundukense]|nr:response regulator transcription factor [Phyllobacterium zundukense]